MMGTSLVFLAFFFFGVLCGDKSYTLDITSIETMFDNDNYIDYSNISMKRITREKMAVDGSITVKQEIGEGFFITVVLMEYKINQYVEGPIRIHTSLCDFMRDDETFYPPLLSNSDLPPECPFMKQMYAVNEYVLDDSKFPDDMTMDKMKIVFTISKESTPVTGLNIYITVDHNK